MVLRASLSCIYIFKFAGRSHIHSAHVPLFAHIQHLEIYYFIINPYYYVGRYDDS